LDRFKLHKEVGLVVNQSRSNSESADAMHRLSNLADRYLTIRLNNLGSIPYDRAIVSAVKKQKPFILAEPQSSAAIAVKKIAYMILDKVEQVDNEGGLRGFVSKLTRLFR
jgi:flagellar biosynthesis protein FlhG